MITGKLYDWLKYLAQILLPAFGTLYFALAGIWNLPSAQEVVGTVLTVDLFLGTLLGISQVNYNKAVEEGGELIIDEKGKLLFQLDEDKTDLGNLGDKQEVRFKVKKESGKTASG